MDCVLGHQHYLAMLQDMLEVELHSKDIHALRNDKQKNFFDLDQCDGANSALAVEKNYIFVMNLTCTLAGCPAYPCHGDFKACFFKLATTYGLFGPGCRKKTIKEWASNTAGYARALGTHALYMASRATSSRSWQIRLVKQCIKDALEAVAPPGQSAMDMVQRQLENSSQKENTDSPAESSGSDVMPKQEAVEHLAVKDVPKVTEVKEVTTSAKPQVKETKPMTSMVGDPRASNRQAVKEREPLLPHDMHLDASLEMQVGNAMAAADPQGTHEDLVKAQNKEMLWS